MEKKQQYSIANTMS